MDLRYNACLGCVRLGSRPNTTYIHIYMHKYTQMACNFSLLLSQIRKKTNNRHLVRRNIEIIACQKKQNREKWAKKLYFEV